MGIRFSCHVCGKQLNIKRELAGRRGVCPSCSSRFRIPTEDAETSTPVDVKQQVTRESPQPAEQVSGQYAAAASVSGAAVHESSASLHDSSPAVYEPDSATPVSVPDTSVATGESAAAVFQSEPVDPDATVPSGVVEQPSHPMTPSADLPSVARPDGEVAISLPDDDPTATWYVRPPSGGQYGPASGEILKQWIEEGRVASTALLWRDGWPQWRDASEALPELAPHLPSGNTNGDAPSIGVATTAIDDRAASADFSGDASVGTERRARSSRRLLLIGILTAVAFALVGVLVVVINRSGS